MGGIFVKDNRETDRRNRYWLDTKGTEYQYRRTTRAGLVRPERVKEALDIEFISIPLPGKNQVVWGFKTYDDLATFKAFIETKENPRHGVYGEGLV